MSKQLKIGFDKVPAPVTLQYPVLLDIQGNVLVDGAGNPLVTEEAADLVSFIVADNSMSVSVNNQTRDEAVPVAEVFLQESEVSNSLLGIPRAEEQLSLFSDVSTYGIDRDNWNYYTFVSNLNYPTEWYTRENAVFGKRQLPEFNETTEEQALYLKSFPVQYSFPFGPRWPNRHNPTLFPQYVDFVAMGKLLYNLFVGPNRIFAEKNFISDRSKILRDYSTGQYADISFDVSGGVFVGYNRDTADVEYDESDLQAAFNEIENFTQFWQKIIDNEAIFPDNASSPVNFGETQYYQSLQTYASRFTRPGYSDRYESFAVLESNKTFRYQPGRISGFTYGVRVKTDLSDNNNFIEWGASNDSDEYLFQLRGSTISIIRRSVLPLPTSLLERMDLKEEDQRLMFPTRVNNDNPVINQGGQTGTHYELTVTKDNFNGDRLDGSGLSGYTLSFEDVTMYKIEFSWYGAIGAKFYAYVPSGPGEARWVLMHTLVIENGMGEPIMKNPDLKFKYLVYSRNVARIREPIFIYKYGSSYYIDGGDEGTVRLSTVTSDTKLIGNRTPLVGVLPKTNIESSWQATEINNYKKLYPTTVSVNSEVNARIDIEEVKGSQAGFHFHYTPSLVNGISPKSKNVQLRFNSTGSEIEYANTSLEFLPEDDKAHVIADGVYNCYIGYDDTVGSPGYVARVNRRTPDGVYDYRLEERDMNSLSVRRDGTIFNPTSREVFDARITNYNSVAASTVPIYSNKFRIHFLQPTSRDLEFGRHFADYAIAISPDRPFIDPSANNELRFETPNDVIEFDIDNYLNVEWTAYEEARNINGNETTEWDPPYGDRFEVDPRIRGAELPEGLNSGLLAAMEFNVTLEEYDVAAYAEGTGAYAGLYRVTFAAGVNPSSTIGRSLGIGEVGIDGEGTGFFFADVEGLTTFGFDGDNYYVYVDGDVSNGGAIDLTATGIQSRFVSITSGWNLKSYTDGGLVRFGSRFWTYSKGTRFNIQPLYLVIAMKDYARVHNIVVEEVTPKNVTTHTPNWIWGEEENITLSTVAGENSVLTPSNFFSQERLSGTRFDTQTLQPMRNGEIVNSFYVTAGKPTKLDLSNIFSQDRKGITTGLYNNRAYFFTATSLDGVNGNAEMTLTVKEQ
jgi:hypothetical protein